MFWTIISNFELTDNCQQLNKSNQLDGDDDFQDDGDVDKDKNKKTVMCEKSWRL